MASCRNCQNPCSSGSASTSRAPQTTFANVFLQRQLRCQLLRRMPELARTRLAHTKSVLTKHLLAKYGAAVRECVEANVADYELVNPQLIAVYAASPDEILATRGLCLFLACQKIAHPLLRSTGPSAREIASRASPALTPMLASTSLLQSNRSSAPRQHRGKEEDAAALFHITFFRYFVV